MAETREGIAAANRNGKMAAGENRRAGMVPSITFFAAEFMGIPSHGEYHEGLETLQEAMDLYEKIPAGRAKGLKGVGFCLEDGSEYAGNCELMLAGRPQTEFINGIQHYKDSPLVQKAVADMEATLMERAGRDKPEPPKEAEAPTQTGRSSTSAGSKKQSVLNALRERQARLKAQEKQAQKPPTHGKGEQEL